MSWREWEAGDVKNFYANSDAMIATLSSITLLRPGLGWERWEDRIQLTELMLEFDFELERDRYVALSKLQNLDEGKFQEDY